MMRALIRHWRYFQMTHLTGERPECWLKGHEWDIVVFGGRHGYVIECTRCAHVISEPRET